MTTIFILMGVVSLGLTILGGFWLLQFHRLKTIHESRLEDEKSEFEISQTGRFAINIVGGWGIKNLECMNPILTRNGSQTTISLKPIFLKPQFFHNGKRARECFSFEIFEPGQFLIKLGETSSLDVKKSSLFLMSLVESDIPHEKLNILIRQSIPPLKLMLGIFFLVIGANLSGWCFLLVMNPNLLG